MTGAKAQVVSRHIFYNESAYDGNDANANAQDDAAIAPDKTPLLPDQTATFANYTSYSRGVNGVMIDISGLPGQTLDASNFDFRVGNDNTPSGNGWSQAPAPKSITVRPGAGDNGSDRVTIIWNNNDIQKQWLQVVVKATAETGLDADDVFYVGNAIGEAGNSDTDARVTVQDRLLTRINPHTAVDPATIDDRYDFDRDSFVNVRDALLARIHTTDPFTALNLITVPASTAALVTNTNIPSDTTPTTTQTQQPSRSLTNIAAPPANLFMQSLLFASLTNRLPRDIVIHTVELKQPDYAADSAQRAAEILGLNDNENLQ